MNWKKVISQLQAAGLTQDQIADKAKCTQAYISYLKSRTRKNPPFDIGQAILDLYKAVCKDAA